MSGWKIRLFGKFTVDNDPVRVTGLGTRQVQELFAFLCLFAKRPQARESVVETLWGDEPVATARKRLRQTLWRLQTALQHESDAVGPGLLIDNEWIQIVLPASVSIDLVEFETVYDSVKGTKVQELSEADYRLMQHASCLYRGDLLQGWYQDWCLFERERFQTMQLLLLDKLVQFCELHQDYELGISYAVELLRYDPAYERAHQHLMRLYFLSGNRTQALHQYERCVIALHRELNVEPSERTRQLFEWARLDGGVPLPDGPAITPDAGVPVNPALQATLHRLQNVSVVLKQMEHQLEAEILKLSSGVSQSR